VTHFGEAFRAHVDAPRPSESGLEETEDEDIRVCVRVCVGGGEREEGKIFVRSRACEKDGQRVERTHARTEPR